MDTDDTMSVPRRGLFARLKPHDAKQAPSEPETGKIVPNRYPHKITIIGLVLAKRPGEVVLDAEIDAATGAPKSLWKHAVLGAKKALRREHGIVIERDRTVGGYLYVATNGKHGLALRKERRARNAIRDGREIMSTVTDDDFKTMPAAEQRTFVQTAARLKLQHEMLSPARQLTEKSTAKNGAIDAGDIASIKRKKD